VDVDEEEDLLMRGDIFDRAFKVFSSSSSPIIVVIMPERAASKNELRLPIEVILIILEYAIDHRPWEIQELSIISKQLRSGLLGRLYQQLHIHSMAQLRSLIVRGKPHHSKAIHSRSYLALYLQFRDLGSGYEFQLSMDLCQKLLSFSQPIQDRIETLGLRTMA
jgi:hypothetical protein